MRLRFLAASAVLTLGGSAAAQVTPPGANAPDPALSAVAVVNGQSITRAELDAAVNANLPTVRLTPAQRRQLHAAVLNDAIDDALLRQFLAANGPKVDPAEIEAQMTALKAQLAGENRTLADFLKETGRTEAQLRADWEMTIRLAGYVKSRVTDEQLKAYHAANRDHFDKVEVRVSHVVVRVGRTATAVERAAAKEKLQKVRAEVLAGKLTFAAAAKKFSQCPSALKGGDLGFIRRRGLPEDEPLAKAAFALAVGGLSEVVETDYGVHLLTVTERKPGTPSAIEKCLVEVLEAYTDDQRAELVAKLRKEAKIQVSLP
jgi:parvulin-like peptidyl-prolyl isomerase